MRSRLLFKLEEPGHDRNSPLATHRMVEIGRTGKHIIYECLMCSRRDKRKLNGQRQILKMKKIRNIMEKALMPEGECNVNS